MFTTLVAVLSIWFQTATLTEGKCSICQKLHIKSTVVMNAYGSCTLMFCGPGYYDEEGKYVAPKPCNTCAYEGNCSNGHHIVDSFKSL